MQLLKVRTSDGSKIARALYADDKDYLLERGPDLNISLDSAVQSVEDQLDSSFFFKVTDRGGALIGFFQVPLNSTQKNTLHFFIKKTARTSAYYSDFFKLVSETIYGEVYQSLGSLNIEGIDNLLASKFTIPLSSYKPFGTNILI